MASKVTRSYFFQNRFQKLFKKSVSKPWDGKAFSHRKTICIIRPNNSREVSQVAQGVLGALMDCIERPHIIPVVGDNNVNELTTLFRDIVRQHPTLDMIFSIGVSSTHIAQRVIEDFDKAIPIFFILIDEKAASHFMRYNSNITGIITPLRDYADQFKHFFYLTQPHTIKKILVPCSRFAHGLGAAYNKDSFGLLSFLTSQKVEVELMTITSREDVHTKVKPVLSNFDLLALSRDHVLETYANELIAMANERHIPLFSSSFGSIEQGAAAGFDSYNTVEFVKQGTYQAKKILVHGVHPSFVSPIQATTWVGTMGINREAGTTTRFKA
jgi:ABC-type uncharacterized transport system substrate-binding protein